MKFNLIIICVYLTISFLWNLLGTGSTAAHSTQTNEAYSDTVFEGLETGTPQTTKTTRNRFTKDNNSYSNITVAIIVLSCLFVLLSLIYFAVSYHRKRRQPSSIMLDKC